jgi:hypothetical protein
MVWAPGVVFGVCNLLILILICRLPDSMGRELPHTVDDLELWYAPPAETSCADGSPATVKE